MAHNAFTGIQLGFLPRPSPDELRVQQHGVVYTKPWVVRLILDLAGYADEQDLATMLAVEPAAGDGGFLVPMVQRLIASCRRHGRPITDAKDSLLAYELNERSALLARAAVMATLREHGVADHEAKMLSANWVRVGDYLFDAPTLPPADFVVGNPPYIRIEDIDETVAAVYRAMYRTMKGRADIYIAFFEAALRQLKPQGVCAFVCADRWMSNQYGAELRRHVSRDYSVDTVIEMHEADAFLSNVSAYPAITILRRCRQGPVVVARAERSVEMASTASIVEALQAIRDEAPVSLPKGLSAVRIATWFHDADPWPRVSPERLALLKQLEERFGPLESEETGTQVGIGVATGADDVFITTDPSLVESSRVLPLAMAYDIEDGVFRWSGRYLINPWAANGLVSLDDFPRLKAYLLRFEARLRQRHIGQRRPEQWYRTIDRVNHALTTQPKLYIPDIKSRIEPVLDRGQTYPHHNLYVVCSKRWDLEVLGGLLLSDLGQFFVECYGVRMRGGYLRFQAQYLRRIRVPRPEEVSRLQAELLRRAFLTRDRELATRVALEVYGVDALPE